ncbi:MAG TPA: ATP-binding protein [Polyangiaceae bacterium]|nr:ATP-binding protein [Polyangiaceae bacterium]
MQASAHVLVVDDSPELVANICEVLASLEDRKFDFITASTGREAIKECRKLGSDLDLALIDLRLPDGDGLALLRDVRTSCPFAEVLIITGDASIESAIAAVGAGAFAYVLKPFRGPDLAYTASRALVKVELVRERERLQRELEESEHRHREMVDQIPAFVLAFDGENRIVAWNRRLEDVTGYSRSELLGRPGRSLVRDGGDRELELKNGGNRLVRWQLTSSSPNLTYALGIDVTEEREMLQRTLRAERLAAVGTLAAGLAHEVRNPLNSSTLQLQVLRRRVERGQLEPDALVEVIDVVRGEITRLDRLVTDFLAFAQPRPLDTTPTNVNDFVALLGEQLRPEAEAQSVKLTLELDPQAGSVELEGERMRQVLLNLTRNALEAMAGTVPAKLTLSTRNLGGQIAIDVVDNGPGFAFDAPIFDAFFTTKETGTGLGLAIAHRIVDEHGGSVQAESKPGRTRFSVVLPRLGPTRQVATLARSQS